VNYRSSGSAAQTLQLIFFSVVFQTNSLQTCYNFICSGTYNRQNAIKS